MKARKSLRIPEIRDHCQIPCRAIHHVQIGARGVAFCECQALERIGIYELEVASFFKTCA